MSHDVPVNGRRMPVHAVSGPLRGRDLRKLEVWPYDEF